MAKESEEKKIVPSKSKNAITECSFRGNECSITNLNGPNCKRKQKDGGCKKLGT